MIVWSHTTFLSLPFLPFSSPLFSLLGIEIPTGSELDPGIPGSRDRPGSRVEWGKVEAFLQLSVRINVWTCLRDLVVLESYLNYVLFVVIVLCYSVMNMKYFRYIGIIDEYVKNRAEKFDSATIMKMK